MLGTHAAVQTIPAYISVVTSFLDGAWVLLFCAVTSQKRGPVHSHVRVPYVCYLDIYVVEYIFSINRHCSLTLNG